MKNFHVFVALVLILFCFQGNYEVMASRICVRAEPMVNCREEKCTAVCNKKYGDPTKEGGGSRGHCVISGTCTCTFICDVPPLAPKFH
ncbi:hypothetical protein NC652_027605 [Populus alba x Populus x berolinensis]|nr:hypothetical protein NC652_027605 [Populus alba x Populus x berolinensis]